MKTGEVDGSLMKMHMSVEVRKVGESDRGLCRDGKSLNIEPIDNDMEADESWLCLEGGMIGRDADMWGGKYQRKGRHVRMREENIGRGESREQRVEMTLGKGLQVLG